MGEQHVKSEQTGIVRETENKQIPESSWRSLCRLLTPHDAPGQWTLQQTVCLQMMTAYLASLGPGLPPELSTQTDPKKRLKHMHLSFKIGSTFL